MNEIKKETKQHLVITGRELLELQGVLKVDDFDMQEIKLTTVLGDLLITGENLHIAELLLDEERLIVSGTLNGVSFVEDKRGSGKRKKSGSLLQRLTK